MSIIENSVVWQTTQISRTQRYMLNNHKSCVLWFTGLPGSGKSTLSIELEKLLFENSIRSYVLDGDNLRHTLNNDLGFSPQERYECIRRVGEVSRILMDAGLFVLVSLISPYEAARNAVRYQFRKGDFIEIFVKCSLQECCCRSRNLTVKKSPTMA